MWSHLVLIVILCIAVRERAGQTAEYTTDIYGCDDTADTQLPQPPDSMEQWTDGVRWTDPVVPWDVVNRSTASAAVVVRWSVDNVS